MHFLLIENNKFKAKKKTEDTYKVVITAKEKPTETEEPNGGTVSSLDEFLTTTKEKETPVPKIKPLEEKVVEPVNSVITQKSSLTLTDEESDDDDFFDDFFDN